MAENYDIAPSSRPKPNLQGTEKASRERGDGPLSDRRSQIAAIVAAAVIVLVLAVFAFAAFGRPVKAPDLQAQLRREKALRDRDEAPHDSPTPPDQSAPGQAATQQTD